MSLTEDRPRYDPADFTARLNVNGARPADTPAPASAPARGDSWESIAAGLALDQAADPPLRLYRALCANVPLFTRTYERRRQHQETWSQSEYDMAIASYTVAAGWTPQQCADAIIASRRDFGDGAEKALRPDYCARAIARARTGHDQADAITALVDESASQEPAGPDEREDIRRHVAQLLKLDVARWLQHNREHSRYTLVLGDGREIAIGPVAHVNSNDRFNDAIVEAGYPSIPVMKRQVWRAVVSALTRIAELTESEDATRAGSVRDWLGSYLVNLRDETPEELWKVIRERQPFYRDGRVYIHARELRKHIVGAAMEKTEVADLTDALRAAGFTRQKVNARDPDAKRIVGASYWYAPREVLGDAPESVPLLPAAAVFASGP